MITAVNDIKTVYRFAWMCNVIEKSYWVKRRKNNQGRNGNSRKRIYIFSDPICAQVSACCSMFLESAEFIVFFFTSGSNFWFVKTLVTFLLCGKSFFLCLTGFPCRDGHQSFQLDGSYKFCFIVTVEVRSWFVWVRWRQQLVFVMFHWTISKWSRQLVFVWWFRVSASEHGWKVITKSFLLKIVCCSRLFL